MNWKRRSRDDLAPVTVSFPAATEDLVSGGTGPMRNRRQRVARQVTEAGGEKRLKS